VNPNWRDEEMQKWAKYEAIQDSQREKIQAMLQ
jgi:hypothetical protein